MNLVAKFPGTGTVPKQSYEKETDKEGDGVPASRDDDDERAPESARTVAGIEVDSDPMAPATGLGLLLTPPISPGGQFLGVGNVDDAPASSAQELLTFDMLARGPAASVAPSPPVNDESSPLPFSSPSRPSPPHQPLIQSPQTPLPLPRVLLANMAYNSPIPSQYVTAASGMRAYLAAAAKDQYFGEPEHPPMNHPPAPCLTTLPVLPLYPPLREPAAALFDPALPPPMNVDVNDDDEDNNDETLAHSFNTSLIVSGDKQAPASAIQGSTPPPPPPPPPPNPPKPPKKKTKEQLVREERAELAAEALKNEDPSPRTLSSLDMIDWVRPRTLTFKTPCRVLPQSLSSLLIK